MSKIIKMTEEYREQLKREFAEAILSVRCTDGKMSFTRTFDAINRKANLYFTEKAWEKMWALLREFDKEVAWHGVARRGEGDGDDYYIEDILVYPQEVTGATVNTDQERYQEWLYQFDDDIFNNIRMQGHSHVYMTTTPSGVDITHQEKILEQLDDDMFYIFLIWNKRGEKTIKIFDLAKNTLFETSDVVVQVVEDENGTAKFIREAKEMVKDRVYTPPATAKPTAGTTTGPGPTAATAVVNGVTNLKTLPQKAEPPAPSQASGRKTKKEKKKTKYGAGWSGSNASGNGQSVLDGFSDDDNPYGPFGFSDSFFREDR